jgi:hypothetical protein
MHSCSRKRIVPVWPPNSWGAWTRWTTLTRPCCGNKRFPDGFRTLTRAELAPSPRKSRAAGSPGKTMPCPRLEFHPDAVAESTAAREWYAARSSRLGEAFLAEMDRATEQILDLLEPWPAYLRGTRCHSLGRFPYIIVYRVRETPFRSLQSLTRGESPVLGSRVHLALLLVGSIADGIGLTTANLSSQAPWSSAETVLCNDDCHQ